EDFSCHPMIGPSFESMTRFRVQTMPARAPPAAARLKVCALKYYILSCGVDFALSAAHDACQRRRALLAPAGKIINGQAALRFIESLDLFTSGRLPNEKLSSSHFAKVKSVQRLPILKE